MPVGVDPVTVAVKVTLCPKVEGLTEELSAVLVAVTAKAGDPPPNTPAPSTTRSAAVTDTPRRLQTDTTCPRPLRCPFTVHPDFGWPWPTQSPNPRWYPMSSDPLLARLYGNNR